MRTITTLLLALGVTLGASSCVLAQPNLDPQVGVPCDPQACPGAPSPSVDCDWQALGVEDPQVSGVPCP